MGTVADTANVDYRLSFADQGNKLSFSVCKTQRNFAVSVCSKQAKVAFFVPFVYTYKYI
jgi:hypothetical protein